MIPSLAYFCLASLQALAMRVGLVPLTALHMWRVPAALVFYAYGLAGASPTLFWVLAGTGDLIAGIYAAGSLRAVPRPGYFKRFHRFGFADFGVLSYIALAGFPIVSSHTSMGHIHPGRDASSQLGVGGCHGNWMGFVVVCLHLELAWTGCSLVPPATRPKSGPCGCR